MAQTGMSELHKAKCGHEGCVCAVNPGDRFCSDYCAKASPAEISGTLPGERDPEGECRCGHPDCKRHH